MVKYLFPVFLILAILAGALSSCKNPSEAKPTDTPHHDTTDTSHHDTTHVDTTHREMDTTSHFFTWKEMTILEESSLAGVWVFGPNDIWVNGSYLYHYDGQSWTKRTFKTSTVTIGGIGQYSMFSPDSTLWLVDGGIIDHCFPATSTAVQYRPNALGSILHASWGTSSEDMFFVGDAGTILHFDGVNFTNFPKVTSENLLSVWGTSSKDVWTCGADYNSHRTVLLHYDGVSWKIDSLSSIPTSVSGGFLSVWCCDSSGHRIATTSGSIVYRKTDDGPWRSDSGKVPNKFADGSRVSIGLRGNSANDLFAIGPWGLVTHWNGASWMRFEQLFEPGNPDFITGGASVNANIIGIVGSKNGQSWILIGRR